MEEMISRLTLAEKASLLAGADMWRTVAIERLGIPAIQVSDGPSGVRGADDNMEPASICLPAGVALGATWNPDLVEAAGAALGAHARSRGVHVILGPTVNIHRTPIAGRNFECYSEDPYLSGTIAASYIRGLQSQRIGACIKHFVANDQEHERFTISSEVAERPLREIYLEPFRIAVEQASPWSLMSSYNRINGTYASENDDLTGAILKDEWGYDGVVMSDWYGTYSERVPAGPLDLEMPGPARFMNAEAIVAAVEQGRLAEAVVDDKVRRILTLVARVTAPSSDRPSAAIDLEAVPRRAATESIVLLKNESGLLPLAPTGRLTIAVIGENAARPQSTGGGSAFVNAIRAISPLRGIRERAGAEVTVDWHIGTPIHRVPPLLDPEWLRTADGREGLALTYFATRDLSGEQVASTTLSRTDLTWFGTVNPYVDLTSFSARLEGTVTVPERGEYTFHLTAVGPARLTVGDRLIIDAWTSEGHETHSATVTLDAESAVAICMEYASSRKGAWRGVRLACTPPLPADPIQEAVEAAARADVAIVVAGLTREWETEGEDRADMRLPGRQDELIARVAAANPRTVVVVNVGSPVEMPWVDAVPTILQTWYGGQDAGHALAEVLFGETSPSGKLPQTIPQRLADNPTWLTYPGENSRVEYGEQLFVGYRYYDRKGIAPLFPFGHGLSYTTFAYTNLRLNGDTFGPGDAIVVEVDITNTGEVAGQEVVQLYLRDLESRLSRPDQELKAYRKIALEPGATTTVALPLSPQSLSYWEPALGRWVAEPGEFVALVGSSSRDIRLRTSFTWVDESYVRPPDARNPNQLSTVET